MSQDDHINTFIGTNHRDEFAMLYAEALNSLLEITELKGEYGSLINMSNYSSIISTNNYLPIQECEKGQLPIKDFVLDKIGDKYFNHMFPKREILEKFIDRIINENVLLKMFLRKVTIINIVSPVTTFVFSFFAKNTFVDTKKNTTLAQALVRMIKNLFPGSGYNEGEFTVFPFIDIQVILTKNRDNIIRLDPVIQNLCGFYSSIYKNNQSIITDSSNTFDIICGSFKTWENNMLKNVTVQVQLWIEKMYIFLNNLKVDYLECITEYVLNNFMCYDCDLHKNYSSRINQLNAMPLINYCNKQKINKYNTKFANDMEIFDNTPLNKIHNTVFEQTIEKIQTTKILNYNSMICDHMNMMDGSFGHFEIESITTQRNQHAQLMNMNMNMNIDITEDKKMDIMWSECYRFAKNNFEKMETPVMTDYTNNHPYTKAEIQGCLYDESIKNINKFSNFLEGSDSLLGNMMRFWDNFVKEQENRQIGEMINFMRNKIGDLDNYIAYISVRNFASPNTTITVAFKLSEMNIPNNNFNEVTRLLAYVIDSIIPKKVFGDIVFTYDIHIVIIDTQIKGFYSVKHNSHNPLDFYPTNEATIIKEPLHSLLTISPYDKTSKNTDLFHGSIYDIRVAMFIAKLYIICNSQKTDTYIDYYLNQNFEQFRKDYIIKSQHTLSQSILKYFYFNNRYGNNTVILDNVMESLPETEKKLMKTGGIFAFSTALSNLDLSPFKLIDEPLSFSSPFSTEGKASCFVDSPIKREQSEANQTVSHHIANGNIPRLTNNDVYRNYLIGIFSGEYNTMDSSTKQKMIDNINNYFQSVNPNIRYNTFEELCEPFIDDFTVWVSLDMQFNFMADMPKL